MITHRWRRPLLLAAVVAFASAGDAFAQELTGLLVGSVKDEQGAALPGARVRLSSPELMTSSVELITNERGAVRFLALPPGTYVLDIELRGFASYREEGIRISAGATIERHRVLKIAAIETSVTVEEDGSRMEARSSGFETRYLSDQMRSLPTRRYSMIDFLRAAPGMSPTSTSNGTNNTLSAFGSGANENVFLIDGTNFTCPCSGFARSELGVDFLQEVQIQSVGASAEYGNMQGAVINVVTRQGGNRLTYDGSYFWQTAGLTSQPVKIRAPGSSPAIDTGYVRVKYHDATSNLGGPAIRDRLWFFGGYQFVTDHDSQPGADPTRPRTSQQNKVFGKLTWQLSPRWRLMQSFHGEYWLSPEQPTFTRPFETTQRRHASVPAITFGNLTHVVSDKTLWDLRVARLGYVEDDDLSSRDPKTPSVLDRSTNALRGNPFTFSRLWIARTTAKATLNHYQTALLGADHAWKTGLQVERGEHQLASVIPTGARFEENSGQKFLRFSREPSNAGGVALTTSAFVSDAITRGDRLTINAGLRFDHSVAISQDLHAFDADGKETTRTIAGRGTLYRWKVLSPRLGVTAKLTADGRTMLRASYGRFFQGVLTAELTMLHPGSIPTTRSRYVAATDSYVDDSVDPPTPNQIDPAIRQPRTDEYSIGVDREILRRLSAAVAYIYKDGSQFVGWRDVGAVYDVKMQLVEGFTVPLYSFSPGSSLADRRFLLTNPEQYSTQYHGIVSVVEKRRSHGWEARGSYTWSRATGLLPSSGTTAGGVQISNLGPTSTFGQDPNSLTNASGRLPNDRPHMFRLVGSVDVPKTGIVLAAHLQYFSGKPWAWAWQFNNAPLNQAQRVLLEPRGTRRLSSQTLLDVRVSRTIRLDGLDMDVTLDLLNLLNNTAEEELASDIKTSPNFGKPNVFIDPRRAMLGVRVKLGR